jgi:hypothetical protein
MSRIGRARPSPALVVACAALLVALSGTSYATVSQIVPRSSVGTAQLKKNAVTSLKVKNGSLRAADFAQGQIPTGSAGPQGLKGDKGEKGEKGDKGETRPSDAYSYSLPGYVSLPGPTPRTFGPLIIPRGGKYIVWAKTVVFTFGPPETEVVIGCDLRAGGSADVSYVSVVRRPAYDLPATLATLVVHEFGGPGSAELVCTSTSLALARRTTITAIRVANLTTSTG